MSLTKRYFLLKKKTKWCRKDKSLIKKLKGWNICDLGKKEEQKKVLLGYTKDSRSTESHRGANWCSGGNIPSSSVRINTAKLSGPGPTSVWAVTEIRYSVHFSSCSKRYWVLSEEIPKISWGLTSSPSIPMYLMEYSVIMPFCFSTGGGFQLTKMLVELGLVQLISWGGADGSNFSSGLKEDLSERIGVIEKNEQKKKINKKTTKWK